MDMVVVSLLGKIVLASDLHHNLGLTSSSFNVGLLLVFSIWTMSMLTTTHTPYIRIRARARTYVYYIVKIFVNTIAISFKFKIFSVRKFQIRENVNVMINRRGKAWGWLNIDFHFQWAFIVLQNVTDCWFFYYGSDITNYIKRFLKKTTKSKLKTKHRLIRVLKL